MPNYWYKSSSTLAQTGSDTHQHSELRMNMCLGTEADTEISWMVSWLCRSTERLSGFHTALTGWSVPWLTDWLQRLPVDWKTGAVNMKVHLRWGSRTQKLLVFFMSNMSSFTCGTLTTTWTDLFKERMPTEKVLECAAYKPGASLQKYDPTACPIFKDRKNPIFRFRFRYYRSNSWTHVWKSYPPQPLLNVFYQVCIDFCQSYLKHADWL